MIYMVWQRDIYLSISSSLCLEHLLVIIRVFELKEVGNWGLLKKSQVCQILGGRGKMRTASHMLYTSIRATTAEVNDVGDVPEASVKISISRFFCAR